jgi:hypothetical protein
LKRHLEDARVSGDEAVQGIHTCQVERTGTGKDLLPSPPIMTTLKVTDVHFGDQVFIEEGGTTFGAVRDVRTSPQPTLVVNVEGTGDMTVPFHAVRAVHDGKVIVDPARLDEALRLAIRHAHDREEPGL